MKKEENARAVKYDREQAIELAKKASRVVVARGSKVIEFDMKKSPPDDDTLARYILGPSGTLRAPAFRVGKTLYVGFEPESLEKLVA